MAKKYLSIEEAAGKLGISSAELNRLREKGLIRAFADRGTWKFKEDDVETLARTRQADSDPDVPLMPSDEGSSSPDLFEDEDALGNQPTIIRKSTDSGSDSDVRLIFDESMAVSEAKGGPPADDSDSDVKLAGTASSEGSDSDVKLADKAGTAADDSDSDVKLAAEAAPADDSDSDVKLAANVPSDSSDSDVKLAANVPSDSSDSDVKLASPAPAADDSDSDVKLAGAAPRVPLRGSDSDVRLVTDDIPVKEMTGSDSDVRLVSSDSSGEVKLAGAGSSASFPVVTDESDETIVINPSESSVTDDESGISLGTGSGIALASDSGISLERPNDSGISLTDDSSLVLQDDSGISLAGEKTSDSGIALSKEPSSVKRKGPGSDKKKKAPSPSDSDDLSGTVPLMDVPLAEDEDLLETQEVPSLGDSSGSGELFGSSEDHTNVITLDDEEEGYDVTSDVPRGAAVLEEEEEAVVDEEEVDVSDELVGEDDELAEDVFGAEDEDFAGDEVESGESLSELPVAPRGMVAAAEQEWGMATHAALVLSTCLMVACGTVLFDMVRNMWHTDAANHNPIASALLDMFKNM
jgi:excisionase family DNA binding protein